MHHLHLANEAAALWLLEEGFEKITIKGPILSRKTTILLLVKAGQLGKIA